MISEHVDPAFDSTRENDPRIANLRNQSIAWVKRIAVFMVALNKLERSSDLLYPFIREALGASSNESHADERQFTRICMKASCLCQLAEYLSEPENSIDGQAEIEKSVAESLKQIDEQEIGDDVVQEWVDASAEFTTPEALRAVLGESAFGLQTTILAGLKNVAVMANRAMVMGEPARKKLIFTARALKDRIAALSKRREADKKEKALLEPELAELIAKIEEWNAKERKAMELIVAALASLEEAEASLPQLAEALRAMGVAAKLVYELAEFGAFHTFGTPEAAGVRVNPLSGFCVAFCGDDFQTLRQLLDAAEFYNFNVWTYGSALAAHMYPELNKSKRLSGHLLSSRPDQNKTLGAFPGATLVSSPTFDKPSGDYADYVFTTYDAPWDSIKRLDRKADGSFDFTQLFQAARDSGGYLRNERAAFRLSVGFGGSQLDGVVSKLADAYRDGTIKRIFVVGGEDSPEKDSDYYAEFLRALPQDALIVSFGDVRFRFNLDGSELESSQDGEPTFFQRFGLPRMLDMGRIADVNSVLRFAEALNKELDKTPATSPVSFRLSLWSERSVAALFAVCAQGYRDVAIGPYQPGVWNESVAELLNKELKVRFIGDPATDASVK